MENKMENKMDNATERTLSRSEELIDNLNDIRGRTDKVRHRLENILDKIQGSKVNESKDHAEEIKPNDSFLAITFHKTAVTRDSLTDIEKSLSELEIIFAVNE